MKKDILNMSWTEWVRFYESPPIYGSRYLFAEFALNTLGLPSQGGEPLPSERGINSRERWYKAIITKKRKRPDLSLG